jgi:two-component system sensor histidine kinase/response regulator
VTAYLTKPLRQFELKEALLSAVGSTSLKAVPVPLVTRHALRESRKNLKVLLAEDNAVNRALAARLLEKRGHTVVPVENGREALEAVEKQSYDLILMDVQMPEMDGFEATTAIRARESGTGRRIPIVAMTAHALKGDRERCLAAGMDDYISKPIRAQELLDVILVVVGRQAGNNPDSREIGDAILLRETKVLK